MMMQKTFGPVVGMEAEEPIAEHPEDLLTCEDTGLLTRRIECSMSHDGLAWTYDDERYDYDVTALIQWTEQALESNANYLDHVDAIDSVFEVAFNDMETIHERVREWLEDSCPHFEGVTDYQLECICDDLMSDCDGEVVNGCCGTSNYEFDLTCWDVGEDQEEFAISDYPILATLHARGDLEAMLDEYDCDHCFYRLGSRDNFVGGGGYPSITLVNNSDKWYWWGCKEDLIIKRYQYHREHS